MAEQLALEHAFGQAAAFTVTSGRVLRGDTACSDCATVPLPVPFSPVIRTLASDGPTLAIISSTGRMAGALGDEQRRRLGPQGAVFALESLAPPQRARQFDLRPNDREHARVVPRLLDEVAGAAAHRLDRQFHGAPGGHDDDRQRVSRGWSSVSSRGLRGRTSCRARS